MPQASGFYRTPFMFLQFAMQEYYWPSMESRITRALRRAPSTVNDDLRRLCTMLHIEEFCANGYDAPEARNCIAHNFGGTPVDDLLASITEAYRDPWGWSLPADTFVPSLRSNNDLVAMYELGGISQTVVALLFLQEFIQVVQEHPYQKDLARPYVSLDGDGITRDTPLIDTLLASVGLTGAMVRERLDIFGEDKEFMQMYKRWRSLYIYRDSRQKEIKCRRGVKPLIYKRLDAWVTGSSRPTTVGKRKRLWGSFECQWKRRKELLVAELQSQVAEMHVEGFTNTPAVFNVVKDFLKIRHFGSRPDLIRRESQDADCAKKSIGAKVLRAHFLLTVFPELLHFPSLYAQQDSKLFCYDVKHHENGEIIPVGFEFEALFPEVLHVLRTRYLEQPPPTWAQISGCVEQHFGQQSPLKNSNRAFESGWKPTPAHCDQENVAQPQTMDVVHPIANRSTLQERNLSLEGKRHSHENDTGFGHRHVNKQAKDTIGESYPSRQQRVCARDNTQTSYTRCGKAKSHQHGTNRFAMFEDDDDAFPNTPSAR
eukprot:GILK01013160.1.p1 GENE.GILK01013160.1~~GILK01013160.1.p1  ORF type:complete len:541 (+),score=38.47 GILK01013160.1:148-1770(+)